MPLPIPGPGGDYYCVYTEKPIKIDGTISDPAWEHANPLTAYIPVTNEEPISKTEVKLMFDDQYLYAAYRAYDKDVWSYFTERNAWCYQEDVCELFFRTHPEEEPYYNFEINALGTVYDAFSLKRNAGGGDAHRWAMWDIEGIKVGTFVKGEINNPAVVDEYWQLEVAIPFAELPTLKGKNPQPGDVWSFHIARYDYSIHLPDGVELSSSARLTEHNFHQCENFAKLIFTK